MALLSLKFVEVNVDGMGEFISGVTHGLKLLAVTVVADAVIGMYGRFCNQAFTRAICFLSTIILLVWSGLVTQIGVIVGAALIGWLFTNSRWLNSSHLGDKLSTDSISVKAKFKLVPIVFFVSLLVVLPLLSVLNPVLEITNSFYQAGSWVFGGGHVMLPLLQEFMLGKLTHDQFLSGYAAAQAVPGPMFTLSTYLGIISLPDNIILGAVLATLAIFLPGFLLLVGVQSRWLYLSESRTLNASITCINASVVGSIGKCTLSACVHQCGGVKLGYGHGYNWLLLLALLQGFRNLVSILFCIGRWLAIISSTVTIFSVLRSREAKNK